MGLIISNTLQANCSSVYAAHVSPLGFCYTSFISSIFPACILQRQTLYGLDVLSRLARYAFHI